MDVPAKTDAELLAEFAAGGSERAIEELIGRHGALVFNLCRRMLSNNADAEDAAQAVFVAMSAHIGSLQDCRCLSAWLHRTAFNACLQIRKAARVRQFREGEAAVMAPKESGEPENDNWEQLKPVLDSELNALPDKYRVPLVLFYFEGRSLDEGAALLRCKPHTLGAWLSRGRELLRSRLDRRGIALSAGVLATLLTEHAASAPLPRAFAAAAAKASTLAITGNSAAAAGISAHGAALLKGAILMGSEQTKAKLIALVIFLLLAGTAAGAYQLTERKAAATVPAATQSQLVEVQKTLDALRQDLSASQAQNAELKRQLQTLSDKVSTVADNAAAKTAAPRAERYATGKADLNDRIMAERRALMEMEQKLAEARAQATATDPKSTSVSVQPLDPKAPTLPSAETWIRAAAPAAEAPAAGLSRPNNAGLKTQSEMMRAAPTAPVAPAGTDAVRKGPEAPKADF